MNFPLSIGRRQGLLCATALMMGVLVTTAWAQVPATTTPSAIPANVGNTAPDTSTGNTAGNSENITVRAQRRLLREKNSPSAVTEIGPAQIAQTGVQGSVATLLRAAPSVYVYQQGIGNNEPVLSIRGTRGLEVAQTYDGVPMQDLLFGGTGSYLNGILGGHFNLDQISGVSIYPGVAYPDKSTFGTIGGTIAYTSLRPSNEAAVDLFGSVGSFGTWDEGFTVNSGRMNGPLGTGVDAPKMMLKYSNLQTSGYIDYTPARFNNMDFAFDKPYDQGQSLFQATVLYNTGSGLTTPEPVPLPYLEKNGLFSNYSPDQEFQRQYNDYLTIILKNDTYINDYLSAGLSTFYLNSDSYTQSYGNPSIFAPAGEAGSVTVDGASPFNQTTAGFGAQSAFGPGGPFYDPQVYSYDGSKAACPASVVKQWAGNGPTPCGYNAIYQSVHNDTYGLQPRVTFTPPTVWGIQNTVKFGGLLAKETEPATPAYFGVDSEYPHTAANATAGALGNNGGNTGIDGGVQRTIYQGFLQDKIDFLDNTLHFTPGVTLEGTDSSLLGSKIYLGQPSASLLATPYCQAEAAANAASPGSAAGCNYGSFKQHKWDREWLPFANVAYDLDKIAPALRGVSVYGSAGTSALFAPVSDFGPNTAGPPPGASIVHMYEGGLKYNRSNLVLSIDYFYQHVERDFGYFSYQSGTLQGVSSYSNNGQREFKGFEAAGIWQVTPQWQLFGNVSHTLAKYLATSLAFVTVQEDQYGVGVRGTPVSGVPDWLSTFGVDYDHHNLMLRNDELNVRFEGQYTGKQQTTYDLSGFENLGPLSSVPGALPGSYAYYNALAGSTTYDPHGGISPFAIFNLDLNYKLPLHNIGPLKTISFDLNVLNIFNTHYFQYFYRQVSPAACGTFPATAKAGFAGNSINSYTCTPQFQDGLPGEPAAITFTTTAHF